MGIKLWDKGKNGTKFEQTFKYILVNSNNC